MFWANPNAKYKVFTDNIGAHLGGHAIVSVGYGINDHDGLKYWLIQNSWGTHWGDDGFAMLHRGKNMLKIEEGAVFLRGWAVGSPEPPIIGSVPNAGTNPLEMIRGMIQKILAQLGIGAGKF